MFVFLEDSALSRRQAIQVNDTSKTFKGHNWPREVGLARKAGPRHNVCVYNPSVCSVMAENGISILVIAFSLSRLSSRTFSSLANA